MVTWGLLWLWAIWGQSASVPFWVLIPSIHAHTWGTVLYSPQDSSRAPTFILSNPTFSTTASTCKCPVPRSAPRAPLWERRGWQKRTRHVGLDSFVHGNFLGSRELISKTRLKLPSPGARGAQRCTEPAPAAWLAERRLPAKGWWLGPGKSWSPLFAWLVGKGFF